MESAAAKAYPRIKKGVEVFVRDVQEYADQAYDQLPTTAVTTSNTFQDRKYEYSVDQPSKIVRDTNRFKEFYFNDLAESLIADSLSFCPHRRDRFERSQHRKRLFELAKLTLDYAGEVTFDADAFDTAFEDHFAPLYQPTHTHRIVFPLPRIILRPEEFEEGFILSLPPLEQSIDRGEYLLTHTRDLTISRISDAEMTAMQNYGTPGMIIKQDQTQKRLGWASILEIEFDVTHRPTKHDSDRTGIDLNWTGQRAQWEASMIAKQVITALRLWEPTGYAGLGPGYQLRDSWKTYREICADVVGMIGPAFQQRRKVYHRNPVELHEADRDAVRNHWQDIGPYCTLRSDADNSLEQCLTRFNRMYERASSEDQVVDAYIGFETSLIRGGPGSMLPKRGAVLLSGQGLADRDDIRVFLDRVRYLRNRIVHNDATLSKELSPDIAGPEEPREYLQQVRWYLAQTIIAYTRHLTAPNESVQEVNQSVIDPQVDQVFGREESVLRSVVGALFDRVRG